VDVVGIRGGVREGAYLVESGRAAANVAVLLGINEQTIYPSRRQERINTGAEPGPTSVEARTWWRPDVGFVSWRRSWQFTAETPAGPHQQTPKQQ
jgi:hypothetical protein